MPAHLLALGTAVPPFALDQKDVAVRAHKLFRARGDIDRLLPVFANTGIEKRHSCVPIDWYEGEHTWKDRSALYVESAIDLLSRVAMYLLAGAKLAKDDIDAI